MVPGVHCMGRGVVWEGHCKPTQSNPINWSEPPMAVEIPKYVVWMCVCVCGVSEWFLGQPWINLQNFLVTWCFACVCMCVFMCVCVCVGIHATRDGVWYVLMGGCIMRCVHVHEVWVCESASGVEEKLYCCCGCALLSHDHVYYIM